MRAATLRTSTPDEMATRRERMPEVVELRDDALGSHQSGDAREGVPLLPKDLGALPCPLHRRADDEEGVVPGHPQGRPLADYELLSRQARLLERASEGDGPNRGGSLRAAQLIAAGAPREGGADSNRLAVEVHVPVSQGADLPLPHSGLHRDLHGGSEGARPQGLQRAVHLLHLVWGERVDRPAVSPWRLDELEGVLGDVAGPPGLFKHLLEEDVDVRHGGRAGAVGGERLLPLLDLRGSDVANHGGTELSSEQFVEVRPVSLDCHVPDVSDRRLGLDVLLDVLGHGERRG